MKRNQPEHTAQAAVIEWCRYQSGNMKDARRIFAIPNGGSRHPAEAARLKAAGTRPGVPDLCLPCPRSIWHGLFIEMKIKPNKPTVEQSIEIAHLRSDGYSVAVCYSSHEAIFLIQQYLSLPKPNAVEPPKNP